jgi:hypothetical protein
VKNLEDKDLIHKAKSDHIDLYRMFAETISVIPLTVDAWGLETYLGILDTANQH